MRAKKTFNNKSMMKQGLKKESNVSLGTLKYFERHALAQSNKMKSVTQVKNSSETVAMPLDKVIDRLHEKALLQFTPKPVVVRTNPNAVPSNYVQSNRFKAGGGNQVQRK